MLIDLKADLILTGANISTVNPKKPRAQAVAVKQGRILAERKTGHSIILMSRKFIKINLDKKQWVKASIDLLKHSSCSILIWFSANLPISRTTHLIVTIIRLKPTFKKNPAAGKSDGRLEFA